MAWQAVIQFWFEECTPQDHWRKSAAIDRQIATRFGELHARAARCELWSWREQPEGRLAEIILLDQFSRHLYRDQPAAFAQDAQALTLAQEAVAQGCDVALEPAQRAFLYMPYMHSESAEIHRQAEPLFDQPGLEDNLRFERHHKAIIDRFGRYPHRNAILGRSSTADEVAFLRQPGSAF